LRECPLYDLPQLVVPTGNGDLYGHRESERSAYPGTARGFVDKNRNDTRNLSRLLRSAASLQEKSI
jgi:hypothetical protein